MQWSKFYTCSISPGESATGSGLFQGFDEETVMNLAKHDIVKLFDLEVCMYVPAVFNCMMHDCFNS